MTAHDIALALRSNTFTGDDLRIINGALRDAHNRSNSMARGALYVGQRVRWMSPRRGGTVEGTITKIAPKNLMVTDTTGSRWRVSPTLVTPA